MCLISKSKYPKIAKKDITVYKVLKSDLTSLYYDFPYKLNKLYAENDDMSYNTHLREYECFSFTKNWIHSYADINLAKDLIEDNLILVECVVPKGTAYHEGYSEICSKKIILKRLLCV